jgi:arylsulfatase A-like enzyme
MNRIAFFSIVLSAFFSFYVPGIFAAPIPTDNLLGYWKLDEMNGTTTVDNSGNGNNGALVGNPAWTAGKVNGALNFNGTTDYVNIPDSPKFDMKDFSVSAWINIGTNGTVGSRIVGQRELSSPPGWGLRVTNNKLNAQLPLDYVTPTPFGPLLNDNKWHHIAMTRDTVQGKITFWVDGISVGTQTSTSTATYAVAAPLIIGANNGGIGFFPGKIDDVRIYGKALTASEVEAMHAAPIPTDNLLGYWKLDEMNGTTTVDNSGNGNNGALVGNPAWTAGKVNGALNFNGTTDYVNIPDSPKFDMKDFSVSAWINIGTNGTVGSRIVGQRELSSPPGWGLRVTNNKLNAQLPLDYVTPTPFGPLLNDNKWHHIAMTRDTVQGKITFWVDGISVGTQTSTSTATYAVAAPLIIGANNGGIGFFPGKIDDVRIYGKALTASEVEAIYQSEAGIAGDTRPNIVVIMSDDQDDTGSMEIMTKVKNLLSDQGVTFTNSFVTFPLCCPSRASFLTGQYSHNNGVKGNDLGTDGGYSKLLPTEVNTLPVWLQDAGYTTALMGKYLNGFTDYGLKIPPGWNTWMGLASTPPTYYNYPINENGFIHVYGSGPAEYQTDVLAQKAADFIESRSGAAKPFFLWLTPYAPHNGAPGVGVPEPPQRYKNLFSTLALPTSPNFNEEDVSDKPIFLKQLTPFMNQESIDYTTANFQRRRETILGLDDMVEKVVNALKTSGKYDNTIIIYTSDNGYFRGEHRIAVGKLLMYEEAIRVPLIISGPGVPKKQSRNDLVTNIDLPATVLAFANANSGRNADGKSLIPVIQNSAAPWRTAFLIEGLDQPYSNGNIYGRFNAVRTLNYKYAEHGSFANPTSTPEQEMYNLSADPYELASVHNNSDYGSAKTSLQSILDTLKNCAGETCWITTQEPAKPIFGFFSSVKNFAASIFSVLSSPWHSLLSWKDILSNNAVFGTPSVAPAEIKDYLNANISLQEGMSSEWVTKLQTFLAEEQGLYQEKTIDGIFGKTTTEAVKRFQERYKIGVADETGIAKENGVVGPFTLKKINEVKRLRNTQVLYDES